MFAYLLYLILDVVLFHLFHCLCLGCCNFMSCLFLGQVWFAAHLNSAHLRCSHVFSALLICFRSSQRLSSLLSSSQLFSLLGCLQCGNFSSKVYLVRSESGPNLTMNMDRHIMRIKIRNQQQPIIDTDIDFHSSKIISHYQHISSLFLTNPENIFHYPIRRVEFGMLSPRGCTMLFRSWVRSCHAMVHWLALSQ